MSQHKGAYQPRLWEAEPANPHPLAALATRQEAAAVAALGGPGRCACGQPASYFEISTAPIWRCQTCYVRYLEEVRALCSMKR